MMSGLSGRILNRVMTLVLTLVGISVVSFSLIRLIPGDPVLNLLGERGGSPEVVAEMRARLGLDLSFPEQYLRFVGQAIQGDLGTSIISQRPVVEEFIERFSATLELGLIAMLLAVVVGVPLGLLAAVRRNSWLDYLVMTGSLVGYSMPIFWWGLVLILVFSVQLEFFPVAGRLSAQFDVPHWSGFMLVDVWKTADALPAFLNAWAHLALPAFVLATVPLATIARMTRSSLLEALSEDYIRTAKAKGLSRTRVLWIHALRNALIPVVTVIGLMTGAIITGAVLTETIFSWPGLGRWLVQSVLQRDYPVIQGGVLLIAIVVMSVNLFVDLLYLWINPRLRGAS